MRAARPPPKKELRAAENAACVGGMRNPAQAVTERSAATGASICEALTKVITDNPRLLAHAKCITEGTPTQGFSAQDITLCTTVLCKALGAQGHTPVPDRLCANAFHAYSRASGDPDPDLVN